MEAFELRLWDGRFGRWLTVDPMGQYFSPYLGMGNNPVGKIDTNGGDTDDFYEKLDADGNPTGEIVWFNGSDKIDGYNNIGSAYSVKDSYNNVIAFGNSDSGKVTQIDIKWMGNKKGGCYYPVNQETIVTNVKPDNGFYGAPVYGEMYLTDDWGDLQARHHNG
ncbi:hypothetical protein [Flavobacterium sp. GCM10023249]|uniref:hypothetical protein n=1 Tax=unclassified Flavobacterium TaxID=196869 RepID=UPI003614052E